MRSSLSHMVLSRRVGETSPSQSVAISVRYVADGSPAGLFAAIEMAERNHDAGVHPEVR